MKSTLSTVGLASVITAFALTGVACGGGSSSDSAASSSSASPSTTAQASSGTEAPTESAAPANYAPLLITPYDIEIPGETFKPGEPQANPGGAEGVAVTFTNESQSRTIGDSILVFPDAEAAKAGLDGAVAALDQSIADPSPQPSEVGENGVIASGASPDGAKAVTVVAFTQGPTFVLMQFDSAPGDSVPDDVALSIAQKQSGLIQSSLG